MKNKTLLFTVSAMVLSAMYAPVSMAAEAEEAVDDSALDEVVVTGSRRKARSSADTPAPVDVIGADEFLNQGDGDISNQIRNVVPSYNVNMQPISDAATLVRPANLRGLAPDQTLVLVNGKRRHRAAVIAFLGGGLSDGAQGPDISAIPSIALKQVEVLRDGAAAQYGSDAIAGVMNFILSDSAEGGSIEAKYGSTYAGDGDSWQIAGTIGTQLGEEGFINLSVEYREADPTSRSVQRDDALGLIADGNTEVRQPYAQIWGQPQVHHDLKAFVNMAVEAGEGRELYAFGNYSERETEGGFFYRNPNTRGGVFSADGGETRLVGDMTPDDGVTCTGGVNFATGNIDDPLVIGSAGEADALASIFADPNCFVFNEMFPGGFTPNFGGNLNDIAGVLGLRGEFDSGLSYDVSVGAGRNEVSFFIDNTVNASLGSATPNLFDLGSYTQLEKNVNIDLVYPIEIEAFASPLNIAGGFEWREEQFSVGIGQIESFTPGVLGQLYTIEDDPATPEDESKVFSQGFGIGANGFSGFSPSVGGSNDRSNVAFYLDMEADVTDKLVMGAAFRWEDFSDFGTTTNFKVSGLYRVTDELTIRSTYSTGFRAPTVGQSNISNISTTFVGASLVQIGIIPPTNPIAQLRGGEQLQPETSKSFSFGTAFINDSISLTVDYFNIKVDGRIASSDDKFISTEEAIELEQQGITGASELAKFRYFANDFDTKTQGIDVIATIPMDLTDEGTSSLRLAANWTDTEVVGGDLGATRIDQLENNLPKVRGNITFNHSQGNWRFLTRANYAGGYREYHLDSDDLVLNPGGEITFDIEAAVTVAEDIDLIVGAENVFNNFPDLNEFGGVAGAKYPVTAPLGFNGGFYYVRVKYNF